MFKITPEAISEDINQKKFWGSMPPDPLGGKLPRPSMTSTPSRRTLVPPPSELRSAPDTCSRDQTVAVLIEWKVFIEQLCESLSSQRTC